MRKIIVVGIATVIAAVAGVGGWRIAQPDPMTVTGSMSVLENELDFAPAPKVGSRCFPGDGYDDIHAGAQVVLKNSEGHTLGVGELGVGKTTEERLDDFVVTACKLPFTVTFTPDGSEFYSLLVGGEQRGAMEYTEEKLRRPVHLALG